jgi:hypothetical protein
MARNHPIRIRSRSAPRPAGRVGPGRPGQRRRQVPPRRHPVEACKSRVRGATRPPDPDPGVEYPEPSKLAPRLEASSASTSDLDRAFSLAKSANGLKDRSELAAALDGGHITKATRVRSLVTTFPDYLLANVVGRHGLRGVAMFTLADPSHPEFAGMTVADDALAQFPLVNVAEARRAIEDQGLKLARDPELVWGWSEQTNSPYYPLWKFSTTAGVTRYVTSMGQVIEDPELQAPARS